MLLNILFVSELKLVACGSIVFSGCGPNSVKVHADGSADGGGPSGGRRDLQILSGRSPADFREPDLRWLPRRTEGRLSGTVLHRVIRNPRCACSIHQGDKMMRVLMRWLLYLSKNRNDVTQHYFPQQPCWMEHMK